LTFGLLNGYICGGVCAGGGTTEEKAPAMIRILLIIPLAGALGVLGWSGWYYHSQHKTASQPPTWPAREPSPSAWTRDDFSVWAETPGDHFNFVTGLALEPGEPGTARLAIHYRSPEDCLYAELAGRQVSLVAVRGGLSRSLASAELAAPLPAGEHAFEMRRRGSVVAVVLDGRILASGFAESFSGGSAALGQQGLLKFVYPRVVELEPVLFFDDFMRPEGMASAWRKISGTWENKGPSKDPSDKRPDIFRPSMSANAFRYSATGRPALTVTGQYTWDLYSLAASLRGAPGGQMGLVFGYRDEKNYTLFRWSARPAPLESAAGSAELLAVVDGQEVPLQRALLGYLPDQWYRVEATLGWGWAEVAIDGHMLLSVADRRLAGGAVGLWASSEAETLFDDVLVAESAAFQERFKGPVSTWNSWDFLNVCPALADGTEAEGLELAAGTEGGQAIFGSSRWANCLVRAEILPQSGQCALLFHYRDAANYSGLSYDAEKGRIELLGVSNGQVTRLDTAEARLEPSMHRFEVRMDRGLVRATIDGGHELFAWQTDHQEGGSGVARSGRAGLAVWDGRVLVRGVSVQLLAEIEPLPVVNPIFATDAEMGTWSTWQGDWATESVGQGKDAATVRWHRARFSGDVQLLVEMGDIPKDKGELELDLSMAKTGEKSANGYILQLIRPAPPELVKAAGDGQSRPGAAGLILTRNGAKVAEAVVPEMDHFWTVALRKAGPFVVGSVNSRELVAWRDPDPLTGQKVAWKSRGIKVDEDGFRVYCPAVHNDTFDRAPVGWRVAEGLWEVTNRWQCDPRWSFFSGRSSSRQKKLAALWSKHEFSDDAVVEFFAGIKMDQARGGQYQYARDINCTLSADGRDLSSGYSFLFGGFDNDHSAILRKGQEVIRTSPSGGSAVIPRTGGIHHRWFYIRAERKGAQLHFTVDGGRLVDLSWTDPDPLPGKRLAIWTWDCGIIFSRVRASGPGCEALEPLDFVPGLKCLSPYPDE